MQAFRFLDKYSDNYCAFIKKVWWVEHLYSVEIGNPERHIRKASHRGSKQQWTSCSQSLLFLLTRSAHAYFVLRSHPVRGEPHNQRNTTGEVARTAT